MPVVDERTSAANALTHCGELGSTSRPWAEGPRHLAEACPTKDACRGLSQTRRERQTHRAEPLVQLAGLNGNGNGHHGANGKVRETELEEVFTD